jgi:opacity protein-like surface antigen
MRSVKLIIAAGAATLLSQAAFAADMAIAPPPQMYAPPPVVEDFGGWYLRGDIGFSNQRVSRLNNALDANNTSSVQNLNFNTAGIFGLGVGYRVNNWFRADVTGEYRGNSQFFGAGVGGARVAINGFTDQGIALNGGVGPALPGLAFGDNVSKWNLAWALHAGLAYKVTPNVTVEFAYRYLDMGDGLTGDLKAFDGTNNINNPTTFKSLTSHDLKMGVRWNFDSPQPVYQAPLVRKG